MTHVHGEPPTNSSLLSDEKNGEVPVVEERLSIALAKEDYWAQAPPGYSTFGEYSTPAQPSEGVDDTGLTIRAMIPMPDQSTREALNYYTGTALAYDARVLFTQPLLSNLTRCGDYHNRICGQVAHKASVQDLVTTKESIAFNCSLSTVLQCEKCDRSTTSGSSCDSLDGV